MAPAPIPADRFLSAQDDPALVRTARSMLGHPYRWGGAAPSEGFDCSGLVYYVYARHGQSVPRTAEAQYEHARPVAFDQIRPGDLLFFRLARQDVSHVAIYLGEYLFIHAPATGKRVTYASLRDDFWQQRFIGAGRI
ncbi:MAG: C40 family peptidase [Pseudomonadota bacterium]